MAAFVCRRPCTVIWALTFDGNTLMCATTNKPIARILISNDDGIDANGIAVLRNCRPFKR